MAEGMTGAEMAAHRHLLGLSMSELADYRGLSDLKTMRDQEAGRTRVPEKTAAKLEELLIEHTQILERLTQGAAEGMVISIPRFGDEQHPKGFWLGLAARLIDRQPDVMLEWS